MTTSNNIQNHKGFLNKVSFIIVSITLSLFIIFGTSQRASADTTTAEPAKITVAKPFESKVSPIKIIHTNDLLKNNYVDLRSKRQLEQEQTIK
ncbi:hypothetical protein [Limosilactobacillus caviae]|uniref:Uncharacterized protein n=1 Tax=Limosilactobacillus caviae TaxID=1769424 RepID=A0ABQ2C4V2_9LACO|nr:hypothetical protein [Limosilactobacillus caviae]MCD7125269.1 hypothetical protein [Limosilactobacillus caviae]MRH46011.1 hypothetical protein [Limosilactobacillus reuteri]GGI63371.1 hypothetical protein GCM10011459_12050 [Limosilactobacillus caviae]